ncbi:hypothetical protein [Lacticaseibacillus hulanensis]|uniref:hypothetical protein n=1 Tax=Lacticaseibacillus hulanensis TaxID=2493111 RepID=UPI000FDC1FCE|nr:hypothetical protein [Lacticaseibacillus hulanensis]
MDGIVMSLMTARTQHLLINVYQHDVDDFYTGYVQSVAEDGVVLRTYSDAGLADGNAFVALHAIASIEVAGADLDNMAYRIATADELRFRATPHPPLAMPLRDESPLLYQVAENLRRTGQAVLCVTMDAENYLEGQIVAVHERALELSVFNKFNYTDRRRIQVDYSSLQVLEYEGYDLTLETALLTQKGMLTHTPTQRYMNNDNAGKILQAAIDSEQPIAVLTRQNYENFYVGRVLTVNKQWAVLKLLDMAGQFGGYTLLRLSAVHSVIIASDYLATVDFYERWGQAHSFIQVPALNQEREFDANTDLLGDLLSEGEIFGRVYRVRGTQDNGAEPVMGTPSAVTDDSFTIIPTGANPEAGVTFRNTEVQALSLGNVYTFLQERWLASK